MANEQKTGLALMREPFPDNQISKLPKPTKQQTEMVRNNFKEGVRCHLCGAWHHKDVVHLDYIGHAAITDRLLNADPNWTWEPLALGADGYPVIDESGGMWIRLTVCGQTRLGYGDAPNKSGGDAMKERIGDAIRNAAMRFGAGLELWHKGTLHLEQEEDTGKTKFEETPPPPPEINRAEIETILNDAARNGSGALKKAWASLTNGQRLAIGNALQKYKDAAEIMDGEIATQA
jgi:hypothetical protein